MFDMLQWVTVGAREEFIRCCHRRSMRSGQLIYGQQDAGAEMYRVVSGAVRLTARRPDGTEAVFLLFGPGDCFGVSTLVDGEQRPQTAECLTDGQIDVLDKSVFEHLLTRHFSFARAVMILLARQMRVVSQYYELHSSPSLERRLSVRLLELAAADPASAVAERPSVHIAQSDLAAMTSTSRQSVNKVLQQLQREGVIRLANRCIVIEDMGELRIRARSPGD
ncbi:MAG TPA: Crp/Fnr family transcriptional regulator [Sphingobium sp.]|nr:Crp/Fnr family transcriptional regulator [Sphingobium sp.]